MQKNLIHLCFRKESISKIFLRMKFLTFFMLITITSVLAKNHSQSAKLTSDPTNATELQQVVVTGTVTDQQGLPIIGATIVVKGTTLGVLTDRAGKYTLTNIPQNATLVFTFIGMTPQEIPLNGQTKIDVVMKEAILTLEDVVVVGYRTVARGTVTGSVSMISSSELQDIPTNNLSNLVAGRLSGVVVQQVAGTPGQESNIMIRTSGTLNNTNPLYVIDGIVSTKYAFDALSSDEVASISILKDAASAAVYGSRGANGVILVTTKRGSNQAPVITYTGSFGVQTPTRIPPALNAYEQALLINDGLAYQKYYTQNFVVDPNDPILYTQDELDYFKTTNYDWIEELWRDPITTQHSLSASGGSENVNYYIGGTYNYATANFSNIDFNKLNLRANIDVKLTDGLKLSLDISTDNRNTHGPNWDTGNWRFEDLYKAASLRSQMVPPSIDGLPVGNWVEWSPVPVIDLTGGYNNQKWTGITSTVALDYKVPFISGLGFNVKFNRYSLNQGVKQFSQPYNMTVFNTTGTHNHIIGNTPVSLKARANAEFLRVRDDKDLSYQVNVQASYMKSFGSHNFDVFLVYEQTESNSSWVEARRNNFVSKAVDQFIGGGAGTADQLANGGESEFARLSYIGALSYNYNRTYLLDFSFRYDGSVIFAPENRWGFFPSVSAGWVISKESFFKANFINELKIRGSVGLLGNDAISAYQWLQKYNLGTGAAFSGVTTSLVEGTLANRDVTWEKSLSYNAGFDSRFWNNMISLKFDAFYRHTYDILETQIRSIPSTFGATMPDVNYAEVNSKGIEVELEYNSSVLTGSNKIGYYIGGNFGYASNKLMRYDEAANIRPYLSRLGLPLGVEYFLGYRATDVIRYDADLDAIPAGWTIIGAAPQLGMLNYEDLRGTIGVDEPDGKIDASDQEYLAKNRYPTMNYGISMGLSWKKLSLDVLFQGLGGHYDMLHANARRVQGRAEESTYALWADRWRPSDPTGKYPAARRFGWPPTDYPASTLFLRNMSFLRCKSVNLSYDLPSSVASKLTMKNIRVFYSGLNLFLVFDHIKDWGYDPEMSNIRAYPMMATHSFGINITL